MLPNRHSIARAGRRAALGFGAAVMLGLGLAFLTAAAWIAMATLRDPLFAALVIGLVYLGVGFILLALAARRDAPPPQSDTASTQQPDEALREAMGRAGMKVPPKGEFPPLLDAFVFGLNVALKLRRRNGGR